MTRLFVRHPVKDFTAWKSVYDSFDGERKDLGVLGDAVFQSIDDPNDVTVWHDFETRETAHAFVESLRLRDAMESAGVAGQPTIWFTEPT